MGSPSPTSTYAISLPRTDRRCFLYGNAAEIMLGFSFFLCGTPTLPSRCLEAADPIAVPAAREKIRQGTEAVSDLRPVPTACRSRPPPHGALASPLRGNCEFLRSVAVPERSTLRQRFRRLGASNR